MNKSNQNILFRGNKLKVMGEGLVEGQAMPSFTLTANDLSDLSSKSFAGKTLVISVVPSLDTPTCSIQTKRFNQEAEKLSSDVVILTVSMDLPFAQKRWCGAEGATKVVTASDYKHRGFGESFGVYMPDLGLLARAVFVVDKQGKITHVEYVADMSQEPDYQSVLQKLR